MHALLIHNPTAGTGSHTVETLSAFLSETGYTVSACSTKEGLFKKCLKERADLILVAGGDGAVTRVIRALPNFDALSLSYPSAPPTISRALWALREKRTYCLIASASA